MALTTAAVLVAAYFLGTFPTARLVARDAADAGSGNPGASNVYRTSGTRAGLLVFAGDLAKGAVAAGAGWALDGRSLALAAGAAAVVGHCFPVARRFRGGKGVATACGTVLVLEPVLWVVAAVMWAAVARLTDKASLASLIIAAGLPLALAAVGAPAWEVGGVAGLGALIGVRHASNIGRLVRGEERSLRPGRT